MTVKESAPKIVGKVITKERDPKTGMLISTRVDYNILTYDSRNEICKWLANSGTPISAGAYSYLAIGYGTTAAAADQSALVSELTRQSSTLSVETDTTTSQDIVFQATTTFTATNSDNYDTVWEIGLFDAASAGNMFNRVKLDVARDNKNNDLEIIYQCIFNSS